MVSCAVNGDKRITDIPLEFTFENYLDSAQDVEGYFKKLPDDVARVMDDNKDLAAGKIVELTAFSVFHGNAQLVSQGGHYTTCRKHERQWYEVNDSVVTGPLLPEEVAKKLQKANQPSLCRTRIRSTVMNGVWFSGVCVRLRRLRVFVPLQKGCSV